MSDNSTVYFLPPIVWDGTVQTFPFFWSRIVAAIIAPRVSRPFSMAVRLLEIHSERRDNERVNGSHGFGCGELGPVQC